MICINHSRNRSIYIIIYSLVLVTFIQFSFIGCTNILAPEEIVRNHLYNENEKGYTIFLSINEIHRSEEETKRIKEKYVNSELAQQNGWSDEYIESNMIAVYADYDVEYDHNLTPLVNGEVKQYFYLLRSDKNSSWYIWDSSYEIVVNETN